MPTPIRDLCCWHAQAGMDMGIVNAAHCVADVYEEIDKELLQHVEDVLLNRSEEATEKMLDYAATLVRSETSLAALAPVFQPLAASKLTRCAAVMLAVAF